MSTTALHENASEPHLPSADAAALTVFGGVSELLDLLPGSWHDATELPDRRSEPRFCCDCSVTLTPLDDGGGGAPSRVTVKDISRHGIGLVHSQPLPYRQVLLTFETADQDKLQFVVRLKWCRFREADLYESGGAIVRVIEPAAWLGNDRSSMS